jgi:hypothetical protein
MRGLYKFIAATGLTVFMALSTQQADSYWWGGNPWYGGYGGGWRHNYVYDPSYRWGSPSMRRYIRNLYLYGPAYALRKQYSYPYPYYGYGGW